MGGLQNARMGKNKKVIENYPPASILACKGQIVKTFKNNIFCQKWPILIIIFVFE